MLVQPTWDEGEVSERQSEPKPTPSPIHPSADQPQAQIDPSPRPLPYIPTPNLNPEGSSKNHGDQAKEIKALKAQIKKLKRKARPVITHHKAWIKSVSMKKRLAGERSLKKQRIQKEFVSKQGRKSAKSVYKDQVFDDLEDLDAMEYMETEAYNEEGVSTEAKVSTDKHKVSTDKHEVSTDQQDVSTDKVDEAKIRQNKKEWRLDAEESDRLRPTSTRSVLTLKPLHKIDPKDKTKKVLEEEAKSEAESEGVNEAEKKFKQLANDEEIAKKFKRNGKLKRIRKGFLLRSFKRKREKFTIKQRAKFLHDTIAAQRKFLAQQWSEAIRKKRFDDSFIVVDSIKDERKIKEMNEEAKDPKKKRLKKRVVKEVPKKEGTTKVPTKQEVTEQGIKKRKGGHIKMIARKRPRPQPNDDSDDEHRKCLRIVTIDSTIDSEVMETKSVISKLHKVSSPDGDDLVVYRANGNFRAFSYLKIVLHIFHRHDLFHLNELVVKQYLEITPEGIEFILWGDLKIMMESTIEENEQVYILELKAGRVIHMLVERSLMKSNAMNGSEKILGVGYPPHNIWYSVHHGSQLTLLLSKELASPGSNSSWDDVAVLQTSKLIGKTRIEIY
ncbi:hypothetical protein Tco_1057769 [Tanacetum coccineum]|uniref:Uncharacterized protein n=1 Tax=Tanacetum coccineum TaxID=301880 RepID=A0ABQ5H841_9ASTR